MILSGTTISYFIPTITQTLGYTGQMAQFMTVPIYVCACAGILAISLSADFFKDRVFHVAIPTAIAGVMYATCAGISNPEARYGLIWLILLLLLTPPSHAHLTHFLPKIIGKTA